MKDPQQSPHFPDAFYRVAMKALFVRDGKILLCHDFSPHKRSPVWSLPGGGLEFGESIPEALKREVKEEMGLTITNVANKPSYIWTARSENGLGMDWWYALLLGFVCTVESVDDFTPTDECHEIRFFSKEDLLNESDLNTQIKPFVDIFNPADFSG